MSHGFSLLETLVALVLGATVAIAVFGVVAMHRAVYLHGVHHVQTAATVRSAAALVAAELRGLDPAGGDLMEIAPTSITYRAGRSLYFTCREPDPARRTITVGSSFHGMRALEADLDSLLVYLPAEPASNRPAGWVPADLRRVVWGNRCPGAAPSLTLKMGGIEERVVAAVGMGSPVRGVSVWQMRGYRDSRGQWWLGMRRLRKGGGRLPPTQPVLGPVAPGGIEFRYYGRGGVRADGRQTVVSIGLTITPEASRRLRSGRAVLPVSLRVALRGARGS